MQRDAAHFTWLALSANHRAAQAAIQGSPALGRAWARHARACWSERDRRLRQELDRRSIWGA